MSTKIHNGYYLKQGRSQEWLQQAVDRIKPFMLQETKRLLIQDMAKHVLQSLLYDIAKGESITDELFEEKRISLIQHVNESFVDLDKGCRADFDYLLSLSVKAMKNRNYIGLFTDHSLIKKIFLKKIPLQHYPFFDHSDRPKSISAKNWKKRKQVWDTLFTRHSWVASGFQETSVITLDNIKAIFQDIKEEEWNNGLLLLSFRYETEKAFKKKFINELADQFLLQYPGRYGYAVNQALSIYEKTCLTDDYKHKLATFREQCLTANLQNRILPPNI